MSRKFLIPPPPAAIAGNQISSSLSVVAIAGIGILTTVVFLLIYYIFVIKCCLHWRRSDQLSPSLPQAESAGLDPSAIRAIPTVRFSPAPAAVECAVCLSEFRGGEMLRLLPGCAHAFHIDCIDTWLQSSASCPLCRTHIADSDCAGSGGGGGGIVPAEEGRKLGYAVSIGDEWIEFRREGEVFGATPLRRSVSMDSSFHRRLYVSVQDVLRRNASSVGEDGGGDDGRGDGGRGRGRRRAFFQFGYWRGGRRGVQQAEDIHV